MPQIQEMSLVERFSGDKSAATVLAWESPGEAVEHKLTL
jgi:hypothetical protein